MIASSTVLLNWLLALPFCGALAAALFPRFAVTPHSPRERAQVVRGPLCLGALTNALGLCLTVPIVALVARGSRAAADYLWTRDLYHLRFDADALSAIAIALIYGCGLLAFLHLSAGDPADDAGSSPPAGSYRCAAILLLAEGFLIAAAAAADLVLLIFALGLAVFTLSVLVSLDAPAQRDALLLGGHLAWLVVLLAAMLMWRQSGDSYLAQLQPLLLTKNPSAIRAAGLLALLGLAPLVAGRPGYGRWMGAARTAPRLAGFASVLLVVSGGIALLRLLPGSLLLPAIPGVGGVSLWLGMALLWIGALAAWAAGDLRGRAGGLTVSQAGCLLVALAGASGPTPSPAFLRAATLHIAFAPPALLAVWLASLTVLVRSRADTLAGLSGLFRRLPLAGLTLLVGGLSLAGMPPLAGFREQSLLLSALGGQRAWPLVSLVLTADLLIAYVVIDTFRRVFPRGRPPSELRRSSLALELPLLLISLALVLAGLWPGPWQQWAELVYRSALTLSPAP